MHNLKDTIEKNCGISTDNQVLLISGGEILQAHLKVISYSSGTDTNPIFMFSTNLPSDTNAGHVAFHDGHNFSEIVRAAVALPASYATVAKRAKIAQKLYEVADEETRRCAQMVFEQHLQQQGWLAVVANMEDLTKEFRQRFVEFYASLDEHLGRRSEYRACLATFEEDLRLLDRIPLSPGLWTAGVQQSFDGFGLLDVVDGGCLDGDDDCSSGGSCGGGGGVGDDPNALASPAVSLHNAVGGSDGAGGNGSNADATNEPNEDAIVASDGGGAPQTLLQWLTASEGSASSWHSLASNCGHIIDMFDAPAMQQLKQTVESVMGQAKQESMREIRGVAPRFQGLDKLMVNATELVKEQCKIATAFQHNQNRASDLGDASILPDLCESHASQLAVMLNNHERLSDMHRRIYVSKEELSNNLGARIRFMVQLENRISDLDLRMLFFNRCLRRVHRHLQAVEQIHCAPAMYVQAMSEVIRRRKFAAYFGRWSAELVGNWSGIYEQEVRLRHEFGGRFEGHFLNRLFRGLDDVPPAFAIDEPEVFDAELPDVSMKGEFGANFMKNKAF